MGLFDRARNGDQHALARLSTLIENDDQAAIDALDTLVDPQTPVHVIGITGPPGAGKSSLINHLLTRLRADGDRVAVLLIDPSSQATGGAVLGDRVRMLSWGDENVFVRSQATRGQEGGLAPSTATLIDLYAHMGFHTVVIETVGVGQDGIDIRAVCDTTVVVQSPHQGDSVQSLKAGILEIANIFVVTKADLPGSHQTVRDLNAMLHLAMDEPGAWIPPVIAISSTEESGFDALIGAINDHHAVITGASRKSGRAVRLEWEISKRAIAQVIATAKAGQVPTSGSRLNRTQALLEATLDRFKR